MKQAHPELQLQDKRPQFKRFGFISRRLQSFKEYIFGNVREYYIAHAFIKRDAALIPLLLIQAIASLSLHNTAFQDEATYLDAGRRILISLSGGERVVDPFSAYFSGFPYFYPVLGGALDLFGGLEAARLLSLACMLATTAAVYYIGKSLFSQVSALFGAAAFASQGPVLFLGHFATYDALCLCLIAVSTALSVRFGTSRSYRGAVAVGMLLFLACTAKYAGLLFFPSVFLVLGWTSWTTHGRRQACLQVGLASLPLMIGFSILLVCTPGLAEGMGITTLYREAMYPLSRSALVQEAVSLEGTLFLLAAAGLIWSVRTNWGIHKSRRLLFAGLMLTSLLVPLYHIDKLEGASFHKHIAFGEFFIAPLAGYALSRFFGYERPPLVHGSFPLVRGGFHQIGSGQSWSCALALSSCTMLFLVGLGQAHDYFGSWSNCTSFVGEVHILVHPKDRILAENVEVSRYYLRDVVGAYQWSHFYSFSYTDSSGRTLDGETAYRTAIDQGYFDKIILTGETSKYNLANDLETQLRKDARYRLEAQVPLSSLSTTYTARIWHKIKWDKPTPVMSVLSQKAK